MKQSVSAPGWGFLSPSLAGLVISAVGLSVAGSVALAATAQGYPGETAGPRVVASASARPQAPGSNPSATPSTAPDPALAPFAPTGDSAQSGVKPTAELQAARVKERAAQRAEGLAKSAAEASRAAVAASTEARQQNLSKAERARQLAAAKIADENLRKAVAARMAAAAARAEAERDATANADPADPAPVPVPIDSGSGGVAPVAGAVIGAHFGQYGSWSRYHTGLDFRAAYGTPIRAVKAGRVLYAGNKGDWAGNHVAILHADGKTSMSSHMSSMAVAAGNTVQAGQVIGYVGQTGRAFGAHLHFEVYPAGVRYGDVYRAINPVPWLRANGVTTH